jgi:hypothetical protein|nr:MAG TPA: hypothetical protein [Bacteriophage sp.]
MLKKLYFHTREGRSYDFDIVATAKVDKPGFTEWIVQVDTNNELGVHEVQASTDDCTFDIVGDDSLIIWELPPIEEDNPIEPEPAEYEIVEPRTDKWTINVKSNVDYIENWSVRGKIRWTEDGSLEILKDNGYRVRLSGYIREFEVDDENQVITARYKN